MPILEMNGPGKAVFDELEKVRAAGGSFADLAIWLRKEKRIVVERSTVMRFLEKQNG